jgi:hypothetical protein
VNQLRAFAAGAVAGRGDTAAITALTEAIRSAGKNKQLENAARRSLKMIQARKG